MTTEKQVKEIIKGIYSDLAAHETKLMKMKVGTSLKTQKAWHKKQAKLVSELEHYTELLKAAN